MNPELIQITDSSSCQFWIPCQIIALFLKPKTDSGNRHGDLIWKILGIVCNEQLDSKACWEEDWKTNIVRVKNIASLFLVG